MSEKQLQKVSENTEKIKNSDVELLHKESIVDIDSQDEEVVREIIARSVSLSHTGPLPHPDILRGYEDVLSGAAERILKMAEKEQEHRINIENNIQEADARDSLLGIKFAFRISMSLSIIGAIIVIISLFMKENIAGIIFGGTMSLSGISSLVATFIKGTKPAHKDK